MIQQALILMLLLGIGACSRSEVTPLPEAAARLEHMVLALPAPFQSGWILAGRYEVTREEFGLDTRQGDHDLPVSMVNFHEAQAWCQERNLRLPNVWEWSHLATSGTGQFSVEGTARNGLDLGLRRPLPVGVFERGRTSLGVYDMLGNVREWAFDGTTNEHFACGGSFAARDAGAGVGGQLQLLPGERAEDVGFRYFAHAEVYLLKEIAPLWSELDSQQRALLREFVSAWRPQWRLAVADILREQGADAGFCDMLARE